MGSAGHLRVGRDTWTKDIHFGFNSIEGGNRNHLHDSKDPDERGWSKRA